MKLGRHIVLLLVVVAVHARADVPGVFAITNGTVHPVSGPEIPAGTVIIRDGLVEAVGAKVAIPADAAVIDVAGAHIYPGLIDAHTSLGFGAEPSRTRPTSPASSSSRPVEPTAASIAAESIVFQDDDLDARRRTGVTTIVAAPRAGIFAGQSAVLNLVSPASAGIVRSPAAMNASFRTRPTWTYPDSLMGVVSYLRQSFLDAQHHAAARVAYERNSAQPRPEVNAGLDALQPVLRREMPIVFEAQSAEMIRRAQAIAREFNLRLIVAGAQQAWQMPQELREVPLLVSVDWPKAPSGREDREEQPLRVIRERVLGPTTPSVLAKGGVSFALVSGGASASDFIPGIRKAIDNGLSASDALRAVTLAPARIFGVDRQLGSLERGKIANLVVTDRPIFDRNAKVTRVFVDGREMRVRAAEETRDASPVNGTWSLTVVSPQGNVAVNVTLRVESGHVSGTFSGDRGSGEISGGLYDRPTLQFTISAQMDAETHDWVFRGTITDGSIEGTVSTNLGTFQFTGSKSE
jgi:imidazolonepropionase-like amidohydrolase